MLRSFLFLFLCVICLFACSDGKQEEKVATDLEVPDHIIPMELMVEVMIEMQILEAKVIESKLQTEQAVAAFNGAQKKLLASYGLDSAQYYESDQFYLQDLEVYSQIVTAMTDSIDYRRNQLKDNQD